MTTMVFNSVTRVDVETKDGQIWITQGDERDDPESICINPENLEALIKALRCAAESLVMGEGNGR